MSSSRLVLIRHGRVVARGRSAARGAVLALAAVGVAALLAVLSLAAFAFWMTRDLGPGPAAPGVGHALPGSGVDGDHDRLVRPPGWSSGSGRIGTSGRGAR